MSLLVLGAGGQIGAAIVECAAGRAVGLDRRTCDIRDPAAVERALSLPGLTGVVNCAACTAVDRAEGEREEAFAVNAHGAAIVARLCHERRLPLLHLSTDYVYDGRREGAHDEQAPLAPCNVYGESKAAGDRAVIEGNPAHLVLRVSWVFGVHGANFVKTMLRLAGRQDELRVVDDQRGGPTEAGDIAAAILRMWQVAREPAFRSWGVYNFAGVPPTTWHGFAGAIFAMVDGPKPRLVAIPSDALARAAARPPNSVLDCRKIGRIFGIAQPDWRQSLARTLPKLASVTR